MLFQFSITVTEEEYCAFNQFWLTRSPYGQKQKRLLYIVPIVAMVFVLMVYVVGGGFTLSSFLNALPFCLMMGLFLLLVNPLLRLVSKHNIKQLLKNGKQPFNPSSVMEFYDDHFVEMTPENRTERGYMAIDQVSVVENTAVYLHINSLQAYIIPLYAFRSQAEYESFLAFIRQKTPAVNFYKAR